MVTHERKEADAFVNVGMQDGQTGQAFPLPLPFRPVPIDLASTGVQGRHEREGPGACRRRRVPVGHRLWLGWEGGGETWSGLQGRLLVHGEDHLIRSQRTGLAVDQLHPRGIDGGVSGLLGMEPPLMAPGLQVMASQKPTHRGGSDVLNAPLGAALVRQFGAIPRRQATAQRIRALAGQTHYVERHLWGENAPWLRGQGHPPDHPGAGREPAGPTCAPPSVARRPPAPRRSGRTLPPAGGASSRGVPTQRPWWSTVASAPRLGARRGT